MTVRSNMLDNLTTSLHASRLNLPEVEEGDEIRTQPQWTYNEKDHLTHSDGWLYAKLTSTSPDNDGDLSVHFLDERREKVGSGYVSANRMFDAGLWGETEPDPELEEKLDGDRGKEDTLAVLEEEQENLVQMQEIRARTVKPGILHLPVTLVTSAENSEKWVIEVDHPVVGSLRFFRDKPIAGWSDDYDIVGLMESYGIQNSNPYELQAREVFVEHTGDDPSESRNWELRRRGDVMNASDDDEGTPRFERARATASRFSGLETMQQAAVVVAGGVVAATLLTVALMLFMVIL